MRKRITEMSFIEVVSRNLFRLCEEVIFCCMSHRGKWPKLNKLCVAEQELL